MDLSALRDALEADLTSADTRLEKLKEFNTSNADIGKFESPFKPTVITILLKQLKELLHSIDFTEDSSTQPTQLLLAGTNTLRLLSRDGTTDQLIEIASLQHIASTAGLYYQDTPYCLAMKHLFSPVSSLQTDTWIEGTKTLINIIFVNHSSILISNILEALHTIGLLEQLLQRIKKYSVDKTDYPLDLTKFDMKLLFLLTACSATERDRVLEDTDGFLTISSLIHQWTHFWFRPHAPKIHRKYLITELTKDTDPSLLEGEVLLTSDILFNAICTPTLPDEKIVALIVDSLKILFSLSANWNSNFFGKPSNKQSLLILYNDLRLIILSFSEWTHSQTYTRLFNDCVNLMMNIPYPMIPVLIPKTGNAVSSQTARDVAPPSCPVSPQQEQGANKGATRPLLIVPYEDRNLSLVKLLVDRLDQGLECSEESRNEMTLTKITLLPTLRTLCRGNPTIRHYVRKRVLPPLGQVTSRPEDGDDIKARIVKLMVHSDHSLAYSTADFLFVLCKENVDRLVKYTGFGNAAGLLMQRGLLAGGAHEGEGNYSSDSEDSDTEEFIQCQAGLDPITAAPKSEDPSVLDSMTEEEKELEAAKLMDAIDKLNKTGVIKLMDTSGKPVTPDSVQTEK